MIDDARPKLRAFVGTLACIGLLATLERTVAVTVRAYEWWAPAPLVMGGPAPEVLLLATPLLPDDESGEWWGRCGFRLSDDSGPLADLVRDPATGAVTIVGYRPGVVAP